MYGDLPIETLKLLTDNHKSLVKKKITIVQQADTMLVKSKLHSPIMHEFSVCQDSLLRSKRNIVVEAYKYKL